jgi:TatD DNase family protein
MTESKLVDVHCHLDFPIFDTDRDAVLQRATAIGISDIIIPGTEKNHWDRISLLCKQHPLLHACYGLHPYWTNQHDKKDISLLEKHITDEHTVAIGECGLDFRKQQADRETQLYYFEAQLKLADENNLPLVIHSVNATETVIQSLKKFKHLKGMIHSYSGSYEQAEQLIDLGFYISISASITYENAKKIKNIAKRLPLTSLLLETDAPDQPGQKYSGKRNEPAYLLETLNEIANLRDEPIETIAAQTTTNAKSLFGI